MKVKIPATLPEFDRKHATKLRVAVRNHWADCYKMVTSREAALAAAMGTLSDELREAIRKQHAEFSALRFKPVFGELIRRAGQEVMDVIDSARKMNHAWTSGDILWIPLVNMECKDFNPLTDRVLRYIETRAEYYEVEFTVEMFASLRQALSEAVTGGWSNATIVESLREFVGLTQHQAATVARGVSERVAKLVAEGVPSKLVAEQAADYAKLYGNAWRRLRRETIARTEVARAYRFGQHESVQQAMDTGIAEGATKTWRHSGQMLNARDEHVAMDSETVPYDQPFSNGDMLPEGINCRCDVEYNIEV